MKIKKIFLGLFATLYAIVAVFLTACLLTFNDYKISIIGDKSLIIVKNDDFEPDYKKGTLLIVQKNNNDDIAVGDDIFFYNTYKNQIVVSHSKVTKTQKISDTQTTYTITGDYDISSDYVIGKTATTKAINNLGSIMNVLESRIGFLVVIMLPLTVLFIFEIYSISKEITRPEEKEDKKDNVKEEPKEAEKEEVESESSDEKDEETKKEKTDTNEEKEEVEEKKPESSEEDESEKTEDKE